MWTDVYLHSLPTVWLRRGTPRLFTQDICPFTYRYLYNYWFPRLIPISDDKRIGSRLGGCKPVTKEGSMYPCTLPLLLFIILKKCWSTQVHRCITFQSTFVTAIHFWKPFPGLHYWKCRRNGNGRNEEEGNNYCSHCYSTEIQINRLLLLYV